MYMHTYNKIMLYTHTHKYYLFNYTTLKSKTR